MFRERIFEWTQNFGRILDAWNGVNAFANVGDELTPSALRRARDDAQKRSIERAREVSRAYMSYPIQGNR